MIGTPSETLPRQTPSVRNSRTRSLPSPTTRSPGRVMGAVPDGTSFRAFPSASYTAFAAMRSKSSLSPTEDDGRGTGAPGFEQPSNIRIQRSALRAAADPVRSAAVIAR